MSMSEQEPVNWFAYSNINKCIDEWICEAFKLAPRRAVCREERPVSIGPQTLDQIDLIDLIQIVAFFFVPVPYPTIDTRKVLID